MPSCDRTWWRWRAGCAASVRRAGSDHCAMLPRTWRNVRMTTESFYRVAEPEVAHYRRCPDWYELQPRPRGTVLYPHMRCWWVRG
jgi:hypothetical protein